MNDKMISLGRALALVGAAAMAGLFAFDGDVRKLVVALVLIVVGLA